MSDFEARREEALRLLKQSGIWRSNYLPPLVRLLWLAGVKVPPPHFAPFFPTFLLTGVFFGGTMAVMMSLLHGTLIGVSGRAWLALFVGSLVFGLYMASYYAYGRSKYRLPPWASLGSNRHLTPPSSGRL
jgi:hypothetical protein